MQRRRGKAVILSETPLDISSIDTLVERPYVQFVNPKAVPLREESLEALYDSVPIRLLHLCQATNISTKFSQDQIVLKAI